MNIDIDDDGNVSNQSTEAFLRTYMNEFWAFVERVHTALSRPAARA